MVHRPADSRLLTNLLSQEKEYTKHLNAFLDSSHSSQASFSAYAAASPPPTSHVIVAVVASFAAADDALRGYVAAVEEWREHLKGLKNLEDEVGNIMRDREILVTRLLKASKFHKPPRDSNTLLSKHNRSSTSSLSIISSSPSSISSTKLSSAQSELQACEAHLASKERELTVARASAVREGLNIRLAALVHCSETWNQMGREGLRAIEGLVVNEGPNAHSSSSQFFSDQNDPNKPLPLLRPDIDPHRPSSNLSHSSLAPSQSASQIGHVAAAPLLTSESTLRANVYNGFNEYNNGSGDGDYESTPRPPHPRSNSHTQIHIPPAHSIDDYAMPSSSRPSSPPLFPYAGNPHRNSTSSINHVNGNGAVNTSSPPNGMVNGTEFNGSRHVLTRRITEEDILSHAIAQGGAKEPGEQAEEPGSSVEELGGGAETEMEVVENPRFATRSQSDSRSGSKSRERMISLQKGANGHTYNPATTASGSTGRTGSEKPNRIRKFSLLGPHRDRDHDLHRQDTSSASEVGTSYNRPSGGSRLFESLRGIFSSHSGQHKDKEGGVGASVSSFDYHAPMISTGKSGKWTTRTEKNLKALKKGGSDDEKDPDNEEIEHGRRTGVAGLFASPSHIPSPPASPTSEHTPGQSPSTNSRRLKKARAGKARSASVPPPPPPAVSAEAEEKEKEGDGVVDLGEITDPDGDVHKETEGERGRGGSVTPTVPSGAPTEPRPKVGPAPEASGGLSHSSSVVSAPTPGSKAPARGTGARAGRGRGGNGSGHKRAASISSLPSPISGSGSATGPTTGTGTGVGAGKGRGGAHHRNLVAPSPIYPHLLTLMSGVNGSSQSTVSPSSPSHTAPSAASRGETDLNWEHWAGAGAGAGGLSEVMKAPPRVGRREIIDSYGGGGPSMGAASVSTDTGTGAVGGPDSTASRAGVSGTTMQMPMLRAPGSVFDTAAEPGPVNDDGMSSSVSAPAMLMPPALNGAGTRRPAKSPLRSALRNPSRTPSPLPPAPLPPAHDEESVGRGGKSRRREMEGQMEDEEADEEGDADGASISSYETGRETLFEEPGAEPPIPPSKSLPNGVGLSHGNWNGNAHPHGVNEGAHRRTASDVSTSTDQGQTIQRRKSVRVSLKPTYVGILPSPVYDDDDAGEAGAVGWSGGAGKERDRSVPDMWEDSSEEDVEYAAARRLLAKAAAGAESKKKKEKGRAR